MLRSATIAAAVCALAVAATPAVAHQQAPQPVKTFNHKQFGKILETPTGRAIYTWTKEKDHHVRCVGSCATAWPPVLVKGSAAPPKHVMGVMGTLGVVMRPNGAHQLTLNGAPLYTYSGDATNQVKCNGVNGWYVLKVH